MTVKLEGLQFASALAGLANYESVSFYFSIPSQNIPVGMAVQYDTTWPLNNTDAVSATQIHYSGIEDDWRYCSGCSILEVPYTGTQYELQTHSHYTGGNLRIDTFVVNQTGGTVTIPDIIVNVRAFLYNAPF